MVGTTPRLSARTAQLILAALLLFFLAWDVRAVLLDNRPGTGFTDSTTVDVLELRQSVRQGGLAGWRLRSAKGPLAAVLGAGADLVLGDLVRATRLLSVACHLVVLWLVFGIARRLASQPAVGLLAVIICGTFPLEFGWFRLDFHEPLVAVAVMACVGAMMGDLRRPASAAWLGLYAGLGLLTKLTFPLFVVLPGLWFAWSRARQQRLAAHLLLACGVAAAVAGWWVVCYWNEIVTNAGDSRGMSEGWRDKLALARALPGLPLLLLGSVAGAALAWWRTPAIRDRLVILALCPVGAATLLLGVFDWWSRYIVPALPLAGLLVALGLHSLAGMTRGRWAAPLARLAGVGLSVILLGLYVHLNLNDVPPSWRPDTRRPPWPVGEAVQRELFLGMIAPDQTTYAGFASAAAIFRHNKWTVLELPPYGPATFTEAWRGLGHSTVDRSAADRLLQAGREVHLLIFHHDPDPLIKVSRAGAPAVGAGTHPPQCAPGVTRQECARVLAYYRWLGAHRLSVVRTFRDPDGARYSVVRIRR